MSSKEDEESPQGKIPAETEGKLTTLPYHVEKVNVLTKAAQSSNLAYLQDKEAEEVKGTYIEMRFKI